MEAPVVKGDGKIILSFKENQCVVETEYAPAPPPPVTPAPVPTSLSREPQLPFYQTILAGNPQGASWLTALVVFQSIATIVGVCILIGVGVYLIHQGEKREKQSTELQVQLKSQEGAIQGMQSELGRLQSELQHLHAEGRRKESEVNASETPMIETNSTK
ncbi:MAG: hypothetical protein V4507_14370 [Verrucomicrobiota bacterium]